MVKLNKKQKQQGWQIVKFGDIAENIVERVQPKLGDEKTFIGLEHVNPGSLKIKKWGSGTELKTQAFKIKEGDILFPKRNTYLKRVAIAPHDCIGSADFIVIRPKNNKTMLSELLKFIMQSDLFHNFAISNSAGSLSKRTKWKLISEFQFPLPPLVRQKEILEVLEKVFNSLTNTENVKNSLLQLMKSLLHHEFCANSNDLESDCKAKNWELMKVGNALNILNSQRKPIASNIRKTIKGAHPYYGPTGILDYINEYTYDGEYVLIGEDGDHFLKWRTQAMTQFVSGKFNVNNHAHVIKGSQNCLTEWFYYFFYHQCITKYLTRQGAGRYKLTKDALAKMLIPIPSIKEQKRLCKIAKNVMDQIKAIEKKLRNSKILAQKISIGLFLEEKQ